MLLWVKVNIWNGCKVIDAKRARTYNERESQKSKKHLDLSVFCFFIFLYNLFKNFKRGNLSI